MSKTYEGYLLIADINGYTRYLSESELEHAQETLTSLLELLVENTGPPLIISRLAGDAVISYGLKEDFFQAQSFVEKIEELYVTFRKALERLVINNTCQCNACANISTLDLKFFVHFGTFGIQHISDHDELVGSDVNLLHRLLKNKVVEATEIEAYALYTEAALRQLGIDEFMEIMTPHRETYEYLGEVKVWVQDLHPVWENKRKTAEMTFPYDDIWQQFEISIDMPRELVWDYLIQPKYRNLLVGADRMVIANRSEGRVAPGSVYQCYHGDKLVPQTILEWRPFERMIVKELSPLFPDAGGVSEYRLDSDGGGTIMTKSLARPTGPFLGRILIYLLLALFRRKMQEAFEKFKHEVESDYQSHKQAEVVTTEFSSQQIKEAALTSLRNSAGSR